MEDTLRAVTLVPYRPNDGPVGERYRWLWDHTLPALEALGMPVFTGEPRGEAWARGQALNAASEAAGAWDVALIADCDTIPEPLSIERAFYWVSKTGGAVRPHMQRAMLNAAGTLVFLQRGADYLIERKHYNRSYPGGGLLVLTRAAWEAVGGYDEDFIGWGYEDSDFNLRLLRHSAWDRIPGRAWHLFHPTDDNHPSPESKRRYRNLLTEYHKDVARWSADKGLLRPERVF
jgi:hypothetical protein